MKKIFGFKICINDEIICRAGFENANSVVSCILNSVRRKNENLEELDISIGGLNSDTNALQNPPRQHVLTVTTN